MRIKSIENMKTLFKIIAWILALSGICLARELPGYLPSAPAADKELVDYTTADVMGAVCTKWTKMPDGHPLAIENRAEKLRAEWPGAKDASNIAAFLDYLLLAPDRVDEQILAGNIFGILHDVMDAPTDQMAAIILSEYDSLNNETSRRRVALFGGMVFPYLLDVRLLALVRERLDDDTVVRTIRPEGAEPVVITVRSEAKKICEKYVLREGFLEVPMSSDDYVQIHEHGEGEEVICARFKDWLLTNWDLITIRVAEVAGGERPSYRKPTMKMFDPRQD